MSKRGTGVMRLKADGTPVDDDDGVLKDGEWVLVSPMIKDASTVPVEHAVAIEDAHAAYVSRMTRRAPAQGVQDTQDATVNDAHAAYIDRLTRRTVTAQETTADVHDDAIDAHDAYVDRLTRRGKDGGVMRDSTTRPVKWLS